MIITNPYIHISVLKYIMRVCKVNTSAHTPRNCYNTSISTYMIYITILYITSSTQSIYRCASRFIIKYIKSFVLYTVPGSTLSFSYSYNNIITLIIYWACSSFRITHLKQTRKTTVRRDTRIIIIIKHI